MRQVYGRTYRINEMAIVRVTGYKDDENGRVTWYAKSTYTILDTPLSVTHMFMSRDDAMKIVKTARILSKR